MIPLRQAGDVTRGEQAGGRELVHLLVAGQARIAEVGHIREHGKRHDVVHHVLVAVKDLLKILPDARLFGNPLQKPRRTIEPVPVIPA